LTKFEKFEILKELKLREARRSFLAFRRLINQKAKFGWWQCEIAGELQQFFVDMSEGKRPILVITAPPQHGKSIQIIEFIAWLAGKNPDCRTIYSSFSERLGIRANLRLQRIYDSTIYKEIFPNTTLNGSNAVTVSSQSLRNREILEYVGHDGYFRNTTVRGSITGESLDLGVIDDPIKGRTEANSEVVREASWNWFTDDFFSRFSEDAGMLWILTRWHVDDPAGRLIDKFGDGVRLLKYPAIAENDEKNRRKGDPLFPELKSLEFLGERRKMMSQANWEALYQQNPVISEGALFKPDAIRVIDAIPIGCTNWVRGWDLAASVGGAYTAGVLMCKMPDGGYLIADVVRGQLVVDERDRVIKSTAERDGGDVLQSIPTDPGAAGKSQSLYFAKQLAGAKLKFSPESGSKESRADGIASQINIGNVALLRAKWNSPFIEELRLFPYGKYKDQVDGMSRAFGEMLENKSGMAIFDFYKSQYEKNK